jgi:hypothetical protein
MTKSNSKYKPFPTEYRYRRTRWSNQWCEWEMHSKF